MNESRPPNADLKDDTQLIRNYVTSLCDAGRTVIVLTHSYGGQVATNALVDMSRASRAARQLPGGVAYLIYMAGFALPEGKAMIDKVQEFGHMELMPLAFGFADDMSVISNNPRDLVVGPGVSDEERDAYIDTFVRWNGNTMYQSIERCAWREISVAYLYTLKDMTVPYDYQKSMVEHMRSEGREVDTYEIDTGHCPNLTATDDVFAIIQKIAARV